ncbi:MAG: hypothetical protein AAF456_12395 [Planctomycetota bacterium]
MDNQETPLFDCGHRRSGGGVSQSGQPFVRRTNWQLVNSPWLLYRWLFPGVPMPSIPKAPPAGVDLFLFAVNIVLAVLVGRYVIRTHYLLIRWGWKKVSE